MASCRRAGSISGCGSLAASACSMRRRQDSSCAANASDPAGSPCTRIRRSAASLTGFWGRRTPGSCTFTARAFDLTERDRDTRGVTCSIGVFDRQIRRHRARDARTTHPDLQGLERMAERVVDRRTLESAMRHAVVAARVLADAVLFPLGVIDQRAVARRVSLIGEQVAGPLPAEYVVRRIAPGRALIGLIAGEKIQEQRRMI